MKKFNQLFKEEAPASDYKREKDSEDEVKDIAPRSKEEEDFVTKHKVNKVGHPVAPESVNVDETTAKMLNNAIGQLSGSNKKRMETEAMKDKKSFEAMVKFAKAAA
jgi:hypothetical protein